MDFLCAMSLTFCANDRPQHLEILTLDSSELHCACNKTILHCPCNNGVITPFCNTSDIAEVLLSILDIFAKA